MECGSSAIEKRGNSAEWKRKRKKNKNGRSDRCRKKLKGGFFLPGCWNSDCRHPPIGFLSVGFFIFGSESLAGLSVRFGHIRRFTEVERSIVDKQRSAYTATGQPCAASPAGNTCWCLRLALPPWAAARVFPIVLIGCHRERHAVYSTKNR